MSAVRIASGLMETLGYLPKLIGMQRPDMRHVHMHRPEARDATSVFATELPEPSMTRPAVDEAEVRACAWPPSIKVSPAMGLYADSLEAQPLAFWDLPDGLVVEVPAQVLCDELAADLKRNRERDLRTTRVYKEARELLARLKSGEGA